MKALPVNITFGGCMLVSGLSDGGLTIAARLIGLGSGTGYGLYSILATIALRRHSPYTVTTWIFCLRHWALSSSAIQQILLQNSPLLRL